MQVFVKRTVFFVVATFFGLLSTIASADGPGPLNGELYSNGNRVLFVVLHGDLSSGASADYHKGTAKRMAGIPGTTSFALIRAGYRDSQGRKSPGSHGGRRDHYTNRNNKLVADTISNLKKSTGAKRVVALGHSGGAAQLGSIIGRFPGLIDSAILVSCPCDITRWRQMRGRSAWNKSQSPSRYVKKVTKSTKVIAITGSNDSNTFPTLAQNYVAKLQSNGVPSSYIEVPGAAHSYQGALRKVAEQTAKREIQR
ncbi:MAG: S9 family peptidase [Pelagimonas sp.]|nr:S9 family peptidase [Pelagimonas sp.]